MSIINKFEPQCLSELPGGLTEVYLDSLTDNQNEVERYPMSPEFSHLVFQESATQAEKEWSQVFDLGDVVLVCVVKAHELEMRLVHLTDRPLMELKDEIVGQGTPGATLNSPFISTEQDVIADLQQTFKRYGKAKIAFDAPIVANLCLIDNQDSGQKESDGADQIGVMSKQANQGAKMHFSRSPDECRFTLVLATQSNHVYHVMFERYYLQKKQTIHVRQSDEEIFQHLQQKKIRCLEQIYDFQNKRNLLVIGSTTYVPPQTQLGDNLNRINITAQAVEETLTFLDESRNPYLLNLDGRGNTQPQPQQRNNVSFFTRLRHQFGIRPGQANRAPQQPEQASNKIENKFHQVTSEALLKPQENERNLEGVVALKVLTNNLLAVTYTNGLFRVIQISNLSIVIETNLLADEGKLGLDSGRIFEAQIAYKTNKAVTNAERNKFSKTISLGVIQGLENQSNYQKRYVLNTMSLRFDDVNAMQENEENHVLLGDNCELIHTRQQVFSEGMVISSVAACDDSSFLYTTYDTKTFETSIFSTSSAQPIWDRGSQELKHQLADKVPIPTETLKNTPQLHPALRKHYFERITAPNRFAPCSLFTQLDQDNLIDVNLSLKENLQRAIEKAPIDNIEIFLQNLIQLEAQHGRIMTIGEPLQEKPEWRVLVRPLGICIVTETSYISSVAAAINLGSIEKEFYWATGDTKLLIEYLCLLKTSVAENLHLLNQRILESPRDIRSAANQCLSVAKNEKVAQELGKKLQTEAGDIQDQLAYFQNKIIEEMILKKVNRGKPLSVPFIPEIDCSDDQPSQLTEASRRVVEQNIVQETDALLQVLVNIYLGQILLQKATKDLSREASLRKIESWICQLSGLQRALTADFIKTQSKSTMTSVVSRLDIQRHGSVLQNLLHREDIVKNFDLQENDVDNTLTRVIQVFTQLDRLMDNQPCHVPVLAQQLCELNQNLTALEYLKVVRTESLGTTFAKILSMVNLAQQSQSVNQQAFKSAVMTLISNTLTLSSKAQTRVDLEQTFLTNRSQSSKQALRERIEKLGQQGQDTRLQYLLMCASELSYKLVTEQGGNKDAEHFVAYFILTCLQLESQNAGSTLADWSTEERDYLYQILLDCQKSNVKILYRAVTNLSDMSTRQIYLLKFFETLRGVNKPASMRNAILTMCPFSQSDITLLVEAIQGKLGDLFSTRDALTIKWREEVSQLVQIYHDVAHLYNWQDQFVRFSWAQWETSISKTLLKNVSTIQKKSEMEQVLNVSLHMMTLAYTACHSCGRDFYFYSSQSVKSNNEMSAGGAKRRTYDQAFNNGEDGGLSRVSNASNTRNSTSNDETGAFWKSIDHLRTKPATFNSGQLLRVDQKRILGTLMICRAKILFLSRNVPKQALLNDPISISKILGELDQPDMAIELALSNNVSPAFAIASFLNMQKNQDIREGEDAEEDEMRQVRINLSIERYLERIKVEHLGELAQYLIALNIDFSPALKLRLIQTKQVSYVIGCYLSPEIEDLVRAANFLFDQDGQACKILIHSDLNQVVNLLQKFELAKTIYAETKRILQNDRDTTKNQLAQINQSGPRLAQSMFRADSVTNLSGLSGIQAVLGQNNIISAILEDEAVAIYSNFDSCVEIEQKLEKCLKSEQSIAKSQNLLEHTLKAELGGAQQRRF